MKDVKKILVALGFTRFAQDTFNCAAELALCTGAELIVCSVINARDVDAVSMVSAMGYDVDGENYISVIKQERKKILADIVTASPFPDEKISAIFRIGHPVEELLKVILTENIDMVVMGTLGRSDPEHTLVGSVAEKIFRRSPATVVSCRTGAHREKLKKKARRLL